MGFGAELKKILKERNMSVAKLARLTGISVNTLYAIINRDSNNISASTTYKIGKALGLDPNELAILDICASPEKWGIIQGVFNSSVPTSSDKESIKEFVDMGDEPQEIVTYFNSKEYTPEELNEIRKYAEFVKSRRGDH